MSSSSSASPHSAGNHRPSDSSTSSSSAGSPSPPSPSPAPRSDPSSGNNSQSASHHVARSDATEAGRESGSARTAISEVRSASLNSDSPVVFIALHAGAGYHNPAHHADLQELFHAACQLALTQASSAEEAVYLAIQLLEASPLTNAGRGSVLTEDGRVECEASMMLGNGAYSGVAAVCGVEHPIQIAYQLVTERNEYGLIKELGRVRPILLVGEGAWKYAEEKGFARVGQAEWYDHHVTEDTRAKWKKYRALIDKHKAREAKARQDIRRDEQQKVAEQQQKQQRRDVQHSQPHGAASTPAAGKKRPRSPRSPSSSAAHVPTPSAHSDDASDSNGETSFHGKQHGTVGAIACDNRGRVCAGVSSGGIWMKTAGRIGSAALIGCGCHAENGDDDGKDGKSTDAISVACSISGCGEDIIEELMAVRCCDALKSAKMSPPSRPSNSIIETNAPVTPNNATNHSSGDSSEQQSELERIMKQLIEKEAMRQATFTANDKKRRKNAQGSNDTQQQDDGLSSGIIACRVVRKNRERRHSTAGSSSGGRADDGDERMVDGDEIDSGQRHGSSRDVDGSSHNQAAQSEELTLDFCYAHTAPHFAVGYAVNDRLNGYVNSGWVSQKTEEQCARRIMKLGHVSIAVTPQHAPQHEEEADGEDDSSPPDSRGSGGREQRQQQRRQRERGREEDGQDGQTARSVGITQSNGGRNEESKRRREDGSEEEGERDTDNGHKTDSGGGD